MIGLRLQVTHLPSYSTKHKSDVVLKRERLTFLLLGVHFY